MTGPTLVITPTYNEVDSIAQVAARLFDAVTDEVELLVVDDGSPDGTARVVEELARHEPRVHLMKRRSKQGLASAYVAGFRWAMARGYEVVVEMDGDLSHDPADVPRLVESLDRGYDLVIGSRYVAGGAVRNWGRWRRQISRLGNLYARRLLRYDVADSTAGFRAYRTAVLDLDDLVSDGYAFQIEMTRRVWRSGGRIAEIPITFTERAAGRSKMGRAIVVEALLSVTRWGIGDRLAARAKT